MKYHIVTFGCQMNVSDSQKIGSVLDDANFEKTALKEEADYIIVNMCSVRQSAVNRVFGLMNNLKGGKTKTILTGCILEKDRRKFKELFDYILDMEDIPKILKLKDIKKPNCYIPVTTGCNNFCSYCVVPYVRGREISRPIKEIINEVKEAVNSGAKEIWLLGQNVNSYKGGFPKLLRMVNDIPGEFWIRFTSSHPKDFSDDLIKAMKECEKVTKYLNLPIQSGDNQILKKMNRPYTVSEYKKIIKKARKAMPNICISTDVIVGFPSETRKQFENTIKIFKEIKYDMAYISEYSPRAGTAAFKMKDNVSKKEKTHRKKELNKVLERTALENNKKYIGKETIVLIGAKGNIGKNEYNKTVKVAGKAGQFVKAKIVSATAWGFKVCLI